MSEGSARLIEQPHEKALLKVTARGFRQIIDEQRGRHYPFSRMLSLVAKVIGGNVVSSPISTGSGILVTRWVLPCDMGLWNRAALLTLYAPICNPVFSADSIENFLI